jgi:hypothetical protein
MGFNTPGFDPGPSPNDWAETEARRAERVQRADNPNGREMSSGSRRVAAWIIGLVALALVLYAVLGWLGVIDVPGFTA